MTIEEAIKRAEETAIGEDELCKRYDRASGYSRSHDETIRTTDAKRCEKIAQEHRQLAEWLKDYKRLLENSSEIPTGSDDCISRQAVLEIYDEWFATCNIADKKESPKAKINALPQVTPIRPKGHWIRGKERHFLDTRTNLNVEMKEATGKGYHTYINAQCSKCRMITIHDDSILYQYCPHCGAKMENEVEE
jgi:hypothetical protein